MKLERSWNTWMTGRMCSAGAVTSIWMLELVCCINEWLSEAHLCSRRGASLPRVWISLAMEHGEKEPCKSQINGFLNWTELNWNFSFRMAAGEFSQGEHLQFAWRLENRHEILRLFRRSIPHISLPCRLSVPADCGNMTLCFCWTALDGLVCVFAASVLRKWFGAMELCHSSGSFLQVQFNYRNGISK